MKVEINESSLFANDPGELPSEARPVETATAGYSVVIGHFGNDMVEVPIPLQRASAPRNRADLAEEIEIACLSLAEALKAFAQNSRSKR